MSVFGTRVELSRNHIIHKVKKIYHLALHRVSIHGLKIMKLLFHYPQNNRFNNLSQNRPVCFIFVIRPLERILKTINLGFPGGPVTKTLCFQFKGNGFNPLLGNKDPTRCLAWPRK